MTRNNLYTILTSLVNKAVFLKNAERLLKLHLKSQLSNKKPKKVNEDRSRFDFCTVQSRFSDTFGLPEKYH